MSFKVIVDEILKGQHRPLSWLAQEMGKTFDGLRLGLINESVKYKDMLIMAKILNVPPGIFFGAIENDTKIQKANATETAIEYVDNLKSCRELAATLKDQLKDKERIIDLLTKHNGAGD